MSAIEQSLRRALLTGDAADPQFRRRIYEAAVRAHDRLVAERGLDEAAESSQRAGLIAAIQAIEAEHAAPPAPDEAVAAESADAPPDIPSVAPGRPDDEPGWSPMDGEPVSPVDRDAGQPPAESFPASIDPADRLAEPMQPATMNESAAAGRGSDDGPIREGRSFDAADAWEDAPGAAGAPPLGISPDETWRPAAGGKERAGKRRAGRSSRPSRGLFFWVAVAAALIALMMLAYGISGFVASDNGTAAPPPEEPVETAAASGPTTAAVEDEWIDVFAGDQLQSVSTPDGGRVTAVSGPGGAPAVRIEGPEGAEGTEIMIPIGPGLLDRLAGHSVRGEVTVGTPDEKTREFGIRCLFDGETACGRQRFSTALPSESFVFDMEVPADPGNAASLAIDPGLGSEGRNLDLYSVRLRILD